MATEDGGGGGGACIGEAGGWGVLCLCLVICLAVALRFPCGKGGRTNIFVVVGAAGDMRGDRGGDGGRDEAGVVTLEVGAGPLGLRSFPCSITWPMYSLA